MVKQSRPFLTYSKATRINAKIKRALKISKRILGPFSLKQISPIDFGLHLIDDFMIYIVTWLYTILIDRKDEFLRKNNFLNLHSNGERKKNNHKSLMSCRKHFPLENALIKTIRTHRFRLYIFYPISICTAVRKINCCILL